jgi:hypothetical protein
LKIPVPGDRQGRQHAGFPPLRPAQRQGGQAVSGQGKLKRLIKPTLGFQSVKSLRDDQGFEVMRMFRKGQFKLWINSPLTKSAGSDSLHP